MRPHMMFHQTDKPTGLHQLHIMGFYEHALYALRHRVAPSLPTRNVKASVVEA